MKFSAISHYNCTSLLYIKNLKIHQDSHKINVFSFTLKPEVWGSREISVIAKLIHSVLSSSSTMFSQNKMISTILACATDDFQKSGKMQYF